MGSLLANPFDPATYRWVAPTFAKAADSAAHLAVDSSPIGGLYVVGGAVNAATGGKTATFDAYAALTRGAAAGTTYSTPTQALSGYQGDTPGQGVWGLPVANKATVKVAAQVVKGTADAVTEGLGLPKLTTLLWIAGGGVLGLGVVAVATRR